jgi:ADP-heptose:LPS heptosyltransferase
MYSEQHRNFGGKRKTITAIENWKLSKEQYKRIIDFRNSMTEIKISYYQKTNKYSCIYAISRQVY